ncbi:LysR family transcriptional regulator [Gluconacetobacter sacchari DSM 12717]|nr:LysR family transcriptional regulator [Gluconacetobacter sacchari DSM 12717]
MAWQRTAGRAAGIQTFMTKMADLRTHMKLRYFRLVEALVATRSIRLAADRMGVTPAAISKACLELEGLLGARLFQRQAGILVPNPLCMRLITAGRRIDAELKTLMDDATRLDNSLHGNVRIGFQAPSLQDRIANALVDVQETHPGITLTMEYGTRPHLLAGLEENVFDLLFVDLADLRSRPRLKFRKLGQDQCVVATMEDIYSVPDVLNDWGLFSSQPWVIPVRGMAMRDRFDSVLAARGLDCPERRIEINSPIASERIISRSKGMTLVPVSMLQALGRSGRPGQEFRFLPEMQLEVGVVWARDTRLSAGAQYVRDFIADALSAKAPPA